LLVDAGQYHESLKEFTAHAAAVAAIAATTACMKQLIFSIGLTDLHSHPNFSTVFSPF
jgi:hypothetical protein